MSQLDEGRAGDVSGGETHRLSKRFHQIDFANVKKPAPILKMSADCIDSINRL